MDGTGTHSVAYLQVSTLPEAWQWHPILAGGSEGKVEVLGMIPNRELHFRSDVLLGQGSKQILLQAVLPQSFRHVCLNFFKGFRMPFQNSQVRWHDQKIGSDRQKKIPTYSYYGLLCRAKEFTTSIFLHYITKYLQLLAVEHSCFVINLRVRPNDWWCRIISVRKLCSTHQNEKWACVQAAVTVAGLLTASQQGKDVKNSLSSVFSAPSAPLADASLQLWPDLLTL